MQSLDINFYKFFTAFQIPAEAIRKIHKNRLLPNIPTISQASLNPGAVRHFMIQGDRTVNLRKCVQARPI